MEQPLSSRSEASPQGPARRRLDRLAARGRLVLLLERVWRLVTPPLLVIGLFICVSWTGIWLGAPSLERSLGVGLFGLGLLVSLLSLRKFRFPSRAEALARIDRVSGFAHGPARVLEDRLGNGEDDAATRALWGLHQRRAEQKLGLLRTGAPSPRLVDLDRYALRAAILASLVAMAFVAGPERYARLAAAFEWRFEGMSRPGARLDAWIDPPAYTGKTPIILDLGAARAEAAQKVEAPAGSLVIVSASGGAPRLEIKGALAAPEKDKADTAVPPPSPPAARSGAATRLVLRGDAHLTLGLPDGRTRAFDLIAIPDQPPTIALTDVPRTNARGSLTLAYQLADDYGVVNAEAGFAHPTLPGGRPATRSLVDPPRISLTLPPGPQSGGEAETTADLSEHPWAGAQVEMTLIAHDEGGNEGKAQPIEIVLPQKPFVKPLARALAEQRRNLVLAPDDKARVENALEGLMIAPEAFGTSASIYLGLRTALTRLQTSGNDADLVAVADFLWEMALRIENGDLSDAERDLRAAEQSLREALEREAPEEEIRKLSENLRAAMDKFLSELAGRRQEQADRNDRGGEAGRTINPKQLQAMLDKMEQMARSGDLADARKMLEQLQNILENLQAARPHKADPRTREMSRALDELGEMSRDQQDLRDETYQNGEEDRRRQRRQQEQMGLSGQFGSGDRADDGDEADQRNAAPKKSSPQSDAKAGELAKRQQALRERLDKLEQRLRQLGQDEKDLDEAQDAMNDAAKALGQGARSGEEAVEAQGRAVDALREGAQKLADAMRQQGEGGASGEAQDGDGEGEEGQGGNGRFGQEDSDPLGRPTSGDRVFNPRARFDPMGAPAAQRAQRVLEELRRRLGEPARPQEELDYLERLLRRY
ncbi:TIGR02302 family protein [Methylocapsa acidiphila]|uniref:TIGR02302 family protein n=1 Tax=Methylocapsa acidiphila TaxID=133552 RepID=UPI000413884B|nr:TIGR02302 family protein [Methylocapsa acidiphila]